MDDGTRRELLTLESKLEIQLAESRAQTRQLENQLGGLRRILYDEHPDLTELPAILKYAAPKWHERWTKLLQQLLEPPESRPELGPADFLGSLPHPSDLPQDKLGIAFSLAKATSREENKDIRVFQELVTITVCLILQNSSLYPPGKVNDVLKTMSNSKKDEYLNALKRGGQLVHETIVLWSKGEGDALERISAATEKIIKAGLSLSQWSTLSRRPDELRSTLASHPPPPPLSTSLPPQPSKIPLFLPSVAEAILGPDDLPVDAICEALKYPCEVTAEGLSYAYSNLFERKGKQ